MPNIHPRKSAPTDAAAEYTTVVLGGGDSLHPVTTTRPKQPTRPHAVVWSVVLATASQVVLGVGVIHNDPGLTIGLLALVGGATCGLALIAAQIVADKPAPNHQPDTAEDLPALTHTRPAAISARGER